MSHSRQFLVIFVALLTAFVGPMTFAGMIGPGWTCVCPDTSPTLPLAALGDGDAPYQGWLKVFSPAGQTGNAPYPGYEAIAVFTCTDVPNMAGGTKWVWSVNVDPPTSATVGPITAGSWSAVGNYLGRVDCIDGYIMAGMPPMMLVIPDIQEATHDYFTVSNGP